MISKHIDYDYEINGNNFVQKYDVPIVKECFSFLYVLIYRHTTLIQAIFDYSQNDDILLKILMIILHSFFEIREIASELLCLIILNGSCAQITSLSFIYLFDSLFSILDFSPQNGETVLKCISRVISAFLSIGYGKDNFQALFASNNANEVFQNLIENNENLEEIINLICDSVDFRWE